MKPYSATLFILFFLISSCVVISTTDTRPKTASDLKTSHINDTSEKKKLFFDFMRPIIIEENAKVLELRKKLLTAKKYHNNKKLVADTAKNYRVAWPAGNENWEKLLEHVDAVVLELALAQSANESAWGQSRFARQGNNFFGQWCFKKGCGMVPEKRNSRATHEVASFKSINESVRSYIKNINTAGVYAPLRTIRKQNRAAGKKPDALAQAGGLIRYSQRREAYVKEIRDIIRVNKNLMLDI